VLHREGFKEWDEEMDDQQENDRTSDPNQREAFLFLSRFEFQVI
jgi:hypothetical protein